MDTGLVLFWLAVVIPVARSAQVICYTGFWSRTVATPMGYSPPEVPPELCDILIYAFMTVNPSTGEIAHRHKLADINQGGLDQTVALKRRNPELKVILSVGGIPFGGVGETIHYSEMMKEPSRRQKFVQSAINFTRDFRFDGLELHWYYPGSAEGLLEDRPNYLELVKELRQSGGTDYILMVTAPFLRNDIRNGFLVDELSKYLDYINVRTIGMNLYGQNFADTASPLRRRSFDVRGTPNGEQNIEDVLKIYTSLGAPKEKLIFGITFEYHVFVLDNVKNDFMKAPARLDKTLATFSNQPGILFYYEACSRVMSGKWTEKRDAETGIPYAVNPQTGQWVAFEDEQTLKQKVQYAQQEGYGGVFVWLMENDDFRGLCGEKHALLNIINRNMKAT